MKINSNTIYIEKESSEYGELETIIKKIASENEIDNVESIQISLSSDEGVIGFKVAQDAPTQGMPTQDISPAGQPEMEQTDWGKELATFQQKKQQEEQPTDQVAAAQTPTNQVPSISSDTQTA